MNPSAAVRVTDPQGVHGTIDTATWPLDGRRAAVLVQFESGQQVLVPLELLVQQEDGSYRLTVHLAAWERPHEEAWRWLPDEGHEPSEEPTFAPALPHADRDRPGVQPEEQRARILWADDNADMRD